MRVVCLQPITRDPAIHDVLTWSPFMESWMSAIASPLPGCKHKLEAWDALSAANGRCFDADDGRFIMRYKTFTVRAMLRCCAAGSHLECPDYGARGYVPDDGLPVPSGAYCIAAVRCYGSGLQVLRVTLEGKGIEVNVKVGLDINYGQVSSSHFIERYLPHTENENALPS